MAVISDGNELSEESFRQLRVDFAEWYDRLGHRYLNMLKVLYREHVNNHFELDRATEVLDLLWLLISCGKLSSTNLTILYDTLKVTEQFAFKTRLDGISLPDLRKHVISKFSPYRLKILELGMSFTRHDVKKLDGIYNEPPKKYEDCWCLIMDLENRMTLAEDDLEPFIDLLQRNHLQQAVRILQDVSGVWPPTRFTLMSSSPQNEDVLIRKTIFERQQILCRDVNRFTPAILNTRYEIDIADMFTDLDLLKVNKVEQDAQPTTLEDVLHLIKSTDACRGLVEGEGGIGKSTLLRYIAYNWANGNGPFKNKILFLVNIRDINASEDVVDAIVKSLNLKYLKLKTGFPENPELIKRFIVNHDDEIVLLLDGLDELRNENQSLIHLFRKRELENSKVILTSRSKKIDKFINNSDVHVKVKGFSNNNIKKYVRKHFEYLGKPTLADSLILALNPYLVTRYKSEIKRIEAILSMCKNPLLLLSICTIWEDNDELPAGNTDLMKEVIRCILNQFINKEDATQTKISRFEVIPDKFVNAMFALGKCMYKRLRINQLSINKVDLEGSRDVIDLALNMGFVYQDSLTSRADLNEIFTASHKLIVESLVGFYFYKQCMCVDSVEYDEYALSDDEWSVIRDNEYLHNARIFAIEFLGANAGKMLNHWITNDFSTYRSLMAHLEFVKEEHLLDVENAVSNHLASSNLEIRHRIPKICRSLRKFIHHFYPSKRIPRDSSFINIMRRVYYTVSSSIVQFNETNLQSLLNGISHKKKGKVIAHILLAVKDQESVFLVFSSIIDDNRYMKYLTNECQKLNLNYDVTELPKVVFRSSGVGLVSQYSNRFLFVLHRLIRLGENIRNIDGSTLVYLLFVFHKLQNVSMSYCPAAGMKDAIRKSLKGRHEFKIKLESLKITHSNLRDIGGSLLASLLLLAPHLVELILRNCNLTGVTINHMIGEYLGRGVDLNLQYLDISENDLSNVNGSLLASLLVMTPNLSTLSMKHCDLTGVIINNMIRNYHPIRRIKLELQRIDLCGNDFRDIDGSLLANLLVMSPNLNIFNMTSCQITGTAINNMIREYYSRRNNLKLRKLDISKNHLDDIDFFLLSCLSRIGPYLKIYMLDSSLIRKTYPSRLSFRESTRRFQFYVQYETSL